MRTPENVAIELVDIISAYFREKAPVVDNYSIEILENLLRWKAEIEDEIKASYEKTNLGDSQAPGCGPDGCVCADGDSENKLKT